MGVELNKLILVNEIKIQGDFYGAIDALIAAAKEEATSEMALKLAQCEQDRVALLNAHATLVERCNSLRKITVETQERLAQCETEHKDLLEALKEMVKWCNLCPDASYNQKAKAAIARAEAEEGSE